MSQCPHASLCFTVSKHAKDAGFERRSAKERLAAALPSDRCKPLVNSKTAGQTMASKKDPSIQASTFPAPLVLPEDDLAQDPDHEPQDFTEWFNEPARNPVTANRRTIYVLAPPSVDEEVSHLTRWTVPRLKSHVKRPDLPHVVEYLRAFYRGMSIRMLEGDRLHFTKWNDGSKATARSLPVALVTESEAIRIRSRPTGGAYGGQLNLNDLLDVAISILPTDAYALVMLVNHDLYEDDADDFCCGRAYGGSRVAVVSTARYNPDLDVAQGIERQHVWPASHCNDYIDACCNEASATAPAAKRRKVKKPSVSQQYDSGTAMGAAVDALHSHPLSNTAEDITNLWLGRICKTASHELGHCFGMDHCDYYACIMQATANVDEDSRQPPYLCPVDMAKVLCATGAGEDDMYRGILEFCERFPKDRLFSSFAAWLEVMMRDLD